jgi:hypothetical protein
MAIDVAALADDELAILKESVPQEISVRWHKAEAPKRKSELDAVIASRPALALSGVKIEQDTDGAWVIVDVSALDPAIAASFVTTVVNAGAKMVTPTKVRHLGAAFVKREGGYLGILEALL